MISLRIMSQNRATEIDVLAIFCEDAVKIFSTAVDNMIGQVFFNFQDLNC